MGAMRVIAPSPLVAPTGEGTRGARADAPQVYNLISPMFLLTPNSTSMDLVRPPEDTSTV